jgi:hypothetical protein
MPANIPEMSAINHLGGQFTHNVFSNVQKTANAASKNFAAQHSVQVNRTAANREKFAQSAVQGIKQGRTAYVKDQATQQRATTQAAKAHAAGVKSGRVAPEQGAAPRTFAMKTPPQGKAAASMMQQQRNFAHGEALKFQQAQFKTQMQQRNNAHTEALKEANQRGKVIKGEVIKSVPTPQVKAQKISPTTFSSQLAPQKPLASPRGATTATFSSPEGKSTPMTPPGAQRAVTGPQFSDVSAKNNSPFPTHQHPAGSSNQILPSLTADQPRTNEFTVGSRAAVPGGIAARGSQLEAWAQTKSMAVKARRASQQAGGRDRSLANTANEWEAAANQPLHKFSE